MVRKSCVYRLSGNLKVEMLAVIFILYVFWPFQTSIGRGAAIKERDGWKTIHVFHGSRDYGSPRLWNAQVEQDKTIVDIFNGKRKGFFLDLAANDPHLASNTYSLEHFYDWSGICIEANSKYMWGLSHRKCEVVWAVAWNRTGDIVPFLYTSDACGDGCGGVVSDETDNRANESHPTTMLPTITLEDILIRLGAPQIIDYFSFDCEGAEAIILSNFPFNKYVFLTITVERPTIELRKKLFHHGYHYVMDHGDFGDQLFIHRRLPNFKGVLEKYGNEKNNRSYDGAWVYHPSN